MNQTCDKCPCPAICAKWAAMCQFAAEDPPDPTRLRWICERSGGVAPAATGGTDDRRGRPDAGEAMRILGAAAACPYRSQDASCGCSGVACALRPPDRRVGSLQDCIACIRAYGDP